MASRPFSIALVGATGAVGRTVLEVLEDLDVPVTDVKLLASARSAGQEVDFRGEPHKVQALAPGVFRGCDVAILCAGTEVSRTWAPVARSEGALVVDDSPAFREEEGVPCVVPEVNADALDGATRGIVANPNSMAIALSLVLKPLQLAAGLERVICATYLAVSGAGQRGVEQLEHEASDLMNGREPPAPAHIPHRIAYNLVPQVGPAMTDGQSGEEAKIRRETRRILGLPDLPISSTAVRVPVFFGHAAAVHVGLSRPLTVDEARAALRGAPAVKVIDQPAEGIYPMPMLAVNDDAVLVGRIRLDAALEHGLALFLAIDNLRKGGATNLVQLAELMAARRPAA
jgi:aspartate-semialdehyde dehydrogenase